MIKRILFLSVALLIAANCFTQKRFCGSKKPAEMDAIDQAIDAYDMRNLSANYSKNKILKVPVAFHVLYNDSVDISNAKLESLIDHLNRAFRMQNTAEIRSNPYKFASKAGDMRIEFYTDTTVRKKVPNKEYQMFNEGAKFDSTGGSNKIENKLNIWICDLSEGLFGYGQFPGMKESTDGVCIDYIAAGVCKNPEYMTYSTGDVVVHEIGHWFGLEHIWGDDCPFYMFEGVYIEDACDGTDHVKDTPNQACPNIGCPSTGLISCKCDNMYVNYMDYTNGECMNMFTKGQVNRVHIAIKLYRKWLLKWYQ